MAKNKLNLSYTYIFIVSFISFVLAIVFISVSDFLTQKVQSLILSSIFILLIIILGIIADIIGVSVAVASEAPLHAKAAKRVSGASEGIYLIRNADRVANICSDVIGDIANTVSGALGIALALEIVVVFDGWSSYLLNMLLTAMIAAITVGGKALGKWISITYAVEVVFFSGKIMHWFSVIRGRGNLYKGKKKP